VLPVLAGRLIAVVPDHAPMLPTRIRNPSSPDRDILRQPGQQNTQYAYRADSVWSVSLVVGIALIPAARDMA
jgi:hypothetical protein